MNAPQNTKPRTTRPPAKDSKPAPPFKQLEDTAAKAHRIADEIRSRPHAPPARTQTTDQARKRPSGTSKQVRSQERKVSLGPHLFSGLRADRKFALSSADHSEPVGVITNSTMEFETPHLDYESYTRKLGNLNISGVRGTEYLGSIRQIGTSPKVSLFSQLINPVYVEGSRLNAIAKMYTRWRPRSVGFHFAPSVPSTSGGSYAMAILPDAADPFLEVGEALARKVMSIDHALICNQFTPGHTKFSWPADNDWAYVNSESQDDRFSSLAQFVMMQMSATTLAANTSLGELFITYDFEFCGTQAPSTASAFSTDITVTHAYASPNLPFGFVTGDISSGSLDTGVRYTAIVVSAAPSTTISYYQGDSGITSTALSPGMILYLSYDAFGSVWKVWPIDTNPNSGVANQINVVNIVTPTIVFRVIPIGEAG